MIALVRAPRHPLLADAAQNPSVTIGPGSASGWTAMLIDEEEDLRAKFPAVLVVALSIAVLATDGAFVEHVGTSGEDWWSLVVFSVLTVMFGAGALRTLRSPWDARSVGEG